MLYLVRKLNESIVINNDIEVKVVEIKRNSIKLGITFPNTATVLRKEIHDRVAMENVEAMHSFDGEILEIQTSSDDEEK